MLNSRIKKAREKAKISQEELAKSLNIGKRTLIDYEKGVSEPKPSTLLNIADICNISAGWLLTGKGDMLKTDKKVTKDNLDEDSCYLVPKLSLKVSAGGGNHLESIDKFEVVENLKLDKKLFKTPQKNLKSIQVDGYSMIPMILPDSWVVFDDTKEYKGDGLYVLNYANTLMVKLIQLNPNGCIEIISVNKDYKSYTVCEDDQNVFKIVGRVVKIIV